MRHHTASSKRTSLVGFDTCIVAEDVDGVRVKRGFITALLRVLAVVHLATIVKPILAVPVQAIAAATYLAAPLTLSKHVPSVALL